MGFGTRTRRPPGPAFWTPLAAGKRIRADPLGYMTELFRDYGDVVCLGMGPIDAWLFHHPDAVKHVLQDNNQNYTKGPIIGRVKAVLGEGLVTSEGDFWRRQRRLAQPAFHRERLVAFAGAMVDETRTMIDAWRARGEGAALDAHAEMSKVTLRIVARTLFSTSLGPEADAIGRAMPIALHHANDYAEAVVKLPPWLPTPANLRFRRARLTLDALVYRIIDERRARPNGAQDLLAMLMAAQDDATHTG